MEIEFTEETRESLSLTLEQFEEFKHLWGNMQEWPDVLQLYFWYETRLGSLDIKITALADWVRSGKKLNLFQAVIGQHERIVDEIHLAARADKDAQIKRLTDEKDYYRLALRQMVSAAVSGTDFYALQELVMNMGNKALVSWAEPQK